MPYPTAQRKRINFMINISLVDKLNTIPLGERSDFVNEAIEEKFTNWSRRKAIENLNESIKKEKKVHTTKEILKILHADRQ